MGALGQTATHVGGVGIPASLVQKQRCMGSGSIVLGEGDDRTRSFLKRYTISAVRRNAYILYAPHGRGHEYLHRRPKSAPRRKDLHTDKDKSERKETPFVPKRMSAAKR